MCTHISLYVCVFIYIYAYVFIYRYFGLEYIYNYMYFLILDILEIKTTCEHYFINSTSKKTTHCSLLPDLLTKVEVHSCSFMIFEDLHMPRTVHMIMWIT